MRSKFLQDKILEIKKYEKIISEKQIEIRKRIQQAGIEETKNKLSIERRNNKAILRVLIWIRMCCEGKDINQRLKIDKNFLDWLKSGHSYNFTDFIAKNISIKPNNYKFIPFFNHIIYYYSYQPDVLLSILMDSIFPENQECSVFEVFSDMDSIIEKNHIRYIIEKGIKQDDE